MGKMELPSLYFPGQEIYEFKHGKEEPRLSSVTSSFLTRVFFSFFAPDADPILIDLQEYGQIFLVDLLPGYHARWQKSPLAQS